MATIKGVILERKGNKVTVLTDSGEFKEFRHSGLSEVGEMIVHRVYSDYSIYAAAVLMLFLITTQMVGFMTVTAYAQVEINPLIELGINRFDRVISATAINKDGERVLTQVLLKGMKTENAISSIVAEAGKEGFINKKNHDVTVTTVPLNEKGKKVAARVIDNLEKDRTKLLAKAGTNEAVLHLYQATKEQRENARREKESLRELLQRDTGLDVSTPGRDRPDHDKKNVLTNSDEQDLNEGRTDSDYDAQDVDKKVTPDKHKESDNIRHIETRHEHDKAKADKADQNNKVIKRDKSLETKSNIHKDDSDKENKADIDKTSKSHKGAGGKQNADVIETGASLENESINPGQSTGSDESISKDNKHGKGNEAGSGAKR